MDGGAAPMFPVIEKDRDTVGRRDTDSNPTAGGSYTVNALKLHKAQLLRTHQKVIG